MFLSSLLIYVLVGAVSGALAGLFGIGGGLVVVPVLILAFEMQQMPTEVLTHVAIATALAVNVITSLSAIRTHHQKQAVLWSLFVPLSVGISLGAVIGVHVATRLDGEQLRWLLGVFLLLVSGHMLWNRPPKPGTQMPSRPVLAVAGGGIGWISSMFGIGGAMMTIPLLSRSNVAMQKAVATAAACGFPIALVGALANMERGWGNPLLADWSLGYVYLPAFCGIIATSALFAMLGAKLSHRLPAERLKRFFAVYLLLMGLRFLFF